MPKGNLDNMKCIKIISFIQKLKSIEPDPKEMMIDDDDYVVRAIILTPSPYATIMVEPHQREDEKWIRQSDCRIQVQLPSPIVFVPKSEDCRKLSIYRGHNFAFCGACHHRIHWQSFVFEYTRSPSSSTLFEIHH